MKIYSIKEMKDSRIFFDKNPPRFMTFFLYMMIVLLVILMLWSSKATKTYVVKSKGLVTSSYTANISNEVGGTIVEVLVKEGQRVQAGEVILRIDTESQDLQIDSVVNQKAFFERNLQLYNQYEEAVQEKKNTFEASGDELEFYGKMKYYLGQVETYNNAENKYDKESEDYKKAIEEYDAKIAEYKKNIEGYTTEINKYASEISSLEKQISDLENQVSQLNKTITTKENLREDTIELISKKEKLQTQISEKEQTKSEKNNKKIELENKKTQDESQKQTLLANKDTLIKNSDLSKENKVKSTNEKESIKSQVLSQLGQERSQVQAQITELEGKYLVDKETGAKFDITAISHGIVHFSSLPKKGMTIQAGTQIGTILSENKEDLIIDTFVSSNDRTKIKEADAVDIVVDGLMQTKYGYLEGNVKSIDTDSTVDNESKAVFFKTSVMANNTYLEDKTGTKVNLKPGMTTEVRIKYDESTWLEWVLEQINVFIR